ncbi:MAG: hypothetical protein PHH82_02765 [Candidatus ainarchaeum sp.]|nr:hypothetical protein [Candidatus ainarchaeum sp.]
MKKLNVKKLVAIGTGVALLAAAVAGAAVTKNDVLDTTGHAVLVNGIVVGETAHVSDVLAANKLSTEVAKLAVYTTGGEVVPGAETCVDATGTVDDGLTVKKKFVGTALGETKGSDNFAAADVIAKGANVGTDLLADESSASYKVGGTTYTSSIREQVALGAQALFDDRYYVGDMGLAYDAEDFVYTVTFGDLNFAKDTATGGYTSPSWTDGTNDKVVIPFLGSTYMVYSINDSSDQIVLVNESSVKSYAPGAKLENLVGKDGKAYYATIDGVVYSSTDPTTVKMTLYNAETGVAETESTKVAEGETFAEDLLDTGVDVHQVDNIGTSDVPAYDIQILLGEDKLTIKNNEGFPYDSTKTKTNTQYDWKSTISLTGGKLTNIVIKNTAKNDKTYTEKSMLNAGETAWLYGDFIGVRFSGLELPDYSSYVSTTKETTTIEFTDALENSDNMPGIKYYGTDDALHELPFYYQLTLSAADDTNLAATFTMDGQDKILKIVAEADGNYSVYTGTGSDVDGEYTIKITGATDWKYTADGDIDINSPLAFTNSGDISQYYIFGYDATNSVGWLFLGADVPYNLKSSAASYGSFELEGSDQAVASSTVADDFNFYLPHLEGEIDSLTSIAAYTDNQISAAYFKVDQDAATANSGEFAVYINTETGKAPLVGEGGSTNDIPTGSQINYSSSTTLIKAGKDTGISWAYNAFGTKFGVESDFPFFVIPEAQAYPEVHIVTGTATVNAEGQVCTTGPETTTPSVDTPYTNATLPVIEADKAGTGKYIVIGGWAVNSLFPEELTANLVKEGDKVLETVAGNVIAAGFTKENTVAVVDELIALLTADDVVVPL